MSEYLGKTASVWRSLSANEPPNKSMLWLVTKEVSGNNNDSTTDIRIWNGTEWESMNLNALEIKYYVNIITANYTDDSIVEKLQEVLSGKENLRVKLNTHGANISTSIGIQSYYNYIDGLFPDMHFTNLEGLFYHSTNTTINYNIILDNYVTWLGSAKNMFNRSKVQSAGVLDLRNIRHQDGVDGSYLAGFATSYYMTHIFLKLSEGVSLTHWNLDHESLIYLINNLELRNDEYRTFYNIDGTVRKYPTLTAHIYFSSSNKSTINANSYLRNKISTAGFTYS